jgi:hypothetical protein
MDGLKVIDTSVIEFQGVRYSKQGFIEYLVSLVASVNLELYTEDDITKSDSESRQVGYDKGYDDGVSSKTE